MITLKMLMVEDSPNFLGIVYPKGIHEVIIKQMTDKLISIPVYARLSYEEKESDIERGELLGRVVTARKVGAFVECDILLEEKHAHMFSPEKHSLNSEIWAEDNEENVIKLDTVKLRALSIVETIQTNDNHR